MQQLLTHITAYHKLSTEAENALQDCFTQITLNKNEFLLTQGNVTKLLSIVPLTVGLWNVDKKNENFFYAMSFVLSLFAAIAV